LKIFKEFLTAIRRIKDMKCNLTQKLIFSHTNDEHFCSPGKTVRMHIDQTLLTDNTGPMAALQFESIGEKRVKTDLSVIYVDHNTLQTGFRNPDDHRFLRTFAARYGLVFSPPGLGICHQLHLENFAKPGATLLGADSHTPSAGGLGSLAIGAGGLSVAMAMAGHTYPFAMPEVIQVHLTGKLHGFSSAKDVILELLRRLTVKGGVGKVFEYAGPGVRELQVPERACICNMGAELGATSSIFPSDDITLEFLKARGREEDWIPLSADPDAEYQGRIEINMDELGPLVAKPHLPDNVVSVNELAGLKVDQVVIGSCTNSSYMDLTLVADILRGRRVSPDCDVLLVPGSKQILRMLSNDGSLDAILASGVRLLECCCGPCIGVGGSPNSRGVSVRTSNRNFEGRSGTKDASIYLTSPVTAAMVALNGKFTSLDTWEGVPQLEHPISPIPSIRHLFVFPPENGDDIEVYKGPGTVSLPPFAAPPKNVAGTVVIKVGDQITTDHIMPANAQINSLRSNLPALAEYVFSRLDADFVKRAKTTPCGIIIGGENYGQGSSREQAAIAPRYLNVQAVIAKSFARIHHDNLINWGIFPLLFVDKHDYDLLQLGSSVFFNPSEFSPNGISDLVLDGVHHIKVTNHLQKNELECLLAGGLLSQIRQAHP